MQVKLVRFTPEPDKLCGEAAAMCYNSDNPERSLRGALSGGHTSVAEHAVFTFVIEDVSRALLAQLTRHRLASFSVQSQRYVSMDECFKFVIPPSIKALGDYAVNEFKYQMKVIHGWYCDWQDRLGGPSEEANQDARFVLPNATCTMLTCTMNARELLHFFELRTCNRAQWEIREMADRMLMECQIVAPELFKRAGCACMHGKPCPEGKRSCGQPRKKVGA